MSGTTSTASAPRQHDRWIARLSEWTNIEQRRHGDRGGDAKQPREAAHARWQAPTGEPWTVTVTATVTARA